MDERRMPDGPPGPPRGPVEELLFGGILEWRGGQAEELREIVDRINRLGLARAELDADGGRNSFLFDDRPVSGRAVTPDVLDRLVDGLQELVDASDDPRSAESTLHCSAIHPGEIVETLLAIDNGRVRPVSRVRARLVAESAHVPMRVVAWRKVVPLGGLLLIGFALLAWQSGYLDRVFSAAPAQLEIDNGPFGDRLLATIDREWGNYEITLRRGAAYPATLEAVAEDRRNAKGIADVAAVEILAAGGTVHVHVLDSRGNLLESTSVELRALVEEEKGTAVAKIHGRIGAARVLLALAEGQRKK